MNIFSSMMSVEDMVTRTAGGEGCDSPGDYLGYYSKKCSKHENLKNMYLDGMRLFGM